jgi:glutaconate CoA-transferase, subunit B
LDFDEQPHVTPPPTEQELASLRFLDPDRLFTA